MEKIRRLRRMIDERRLETLIQIDGGVTPDNTAELVRAGAGRAGVRLGLFLGSSL